MGVRDLARVVGVGLAAGIAGAILANANWADDERDPPTGSELTRAASVRVPDDLRRLQARVEALERARRERAPATAPNPEGDPRNMRDHSVPLDPSQPMDDPMERQMRVWEQQTRDDGWANATEAGIRAVVADAPSGGEILSLECRTTMCLLLVEHPNSLSRELFLQEVIWTPEFRGEGGMRRENTSGRLLTRFIVGREGHSIHER